MANRLSTQNKVIMMTDNLPKLKQPGELLNHILDHPELSAAIQDLEAGVLARLIRHVGLEDSAEIISMATVDQLKRVFDEDLWHRDAPGSEETFDAGRFGLWLQMMLETGPAFAAGKVRELDEDLVTLGLSQLVLVVDLDELALCMSDGNRSFKDDLVDKVLESTLNLEMDAYLVIARNDAHWEAVQALLVELNEVDHATMGRLLERCCRISTEFIEDNGGFYDVLTAEQMLETDVAAEREARRERQGYVSASAAAFFLNTARTTPLKKIVAGKTLDAATRSYFRAMDAGGDAAAKPKKRVQPTGKASQGRSEVTVARFLQTLRAADVLPAQDLKKLDDPGRHHVPLANAMRHINRTDPCLYAKRLTELTYLSNVLIAGCGFEGRAFRPVEAAEAAFSVCNLGSEYLLGSETGPDDNPPAGPLAALLAEHRLVTLFQAGWRILNDRVVLHAAKAVLGFLERLGEERPAHEATLLADTLRTFISSGGPWAFHDQMDRLQMFVDGETAMALASLLQMYPTLSEGMCKRGRHRPSPYIWSRGHIRTIRHFLKDVL